MKFIIDFIINFVFSSFIGKEKKLTESMKCKNFVQQLEKEIKELSAFIPEIPSSAEDDEYDDVKDYLWDRKHFIDVYKRELIRMKQKETTEKQMINLDSLPFCYDIKMKIGEFYRD